MSRTSNPWSGMRRPTGTSISTRLVDMERCSDDTIVCWALTSSGNKALLINCAPSARDATFRKLSHIAIRKPSDGRGLLIELEDGRLLDQFESVCNDVVNVVSRSSANNVLTVVALCLDKWRYLLKPGGILSPQEQKGLIAELLFLERVALRNIAPVQAIRSWTGPYESPRDFSFGNTYVEVKSNRGAQNPWITISSEQQLSTGDSERLFLYVVGMDKSPQGPCLSDYVDNAKRLVANDILAYEELSARLAALGYREDEEYSEHRWRELDTTILHVRDGFPRIQTGDLPFGIERVSYRVNLDYCKDYAVEVDQVNQAIQENNDRD